MQGGWHDQKERLKETKSDQLMSLVRTQYTLCSVHNINCVQSVLGHH